MARTLDLYALIQQPETQRDQEWERAFIEAFVDAKIELVGEESQVGPDGWPYLYTKTSAQGSEPVGKVIKWLAERGIGLVVNPHKVMPDYIFPYGMIWHYAETGQFVMAPTNNRSGEVFLQKDKKYIFGPPSETYLPKYVRGILREFLKAQGMTAPKVLVISSEDFKQVDLVFSVESLGSPEAAQHQAIADSLAWFLPLHYSIILASEKGLPVFADL